MRCGALLRMSALLGKLVLGHCAPEPTPAPSPKPQGLQGPCVHLALEHTAPERQGLQRGGGCGMVLNTEGPGGQAGSEGAGGGARGVDVPAEG